MRCFETLLLLFLSSGFVHSANILGIFPLHVKSHYLMFERVMKGLAEKGHSVDIVTQFPSKDIPPKFNQLSLQGTVPDLINSLPVTRVEHFSFYDIVHFIVKLNGYDICELMLKTKTMEDLRNTTKKYDLVVTEIFGSDCMLGYAHLFKAPVVSMISSVILPWANDRIGNPDNPSYIPNYFLAATDDLNLYGRTKNTLMLVLAKYWYRALSTSPSNQLVQKYFGSDLPSLEKLAQNTSLILVNGHFSFSTVRPNVPNVIEIGGVHIQEPKPLTPHFENLLKTDSKGVILLTMGSMVMTETFEPEIIQAMFDAFAELPYKVLWKAQPEKFPKGLKIPKNVHFEKWLPQTDILCHPNVKLFVSHGGLMGSQESIYCGVPILGIPLFADQVHNIEIFQKNGFAIKLGYKDIKKGPFLEAARKLLADKKYREAIKEVSKLFKDRPMKPLETAIYWIEYVIRHKGAPKLRSAGANMIWYQYYLVDVVLVLLSASFVFVYLLFKICQVVSRFLFSKNKTKKD